MKILIAIYAISLAVMIYSFATAQLVDENFNPVEEDLTKVQNPHKSTVQ